MTAEATEATAVVAEPPVVEGPPAMSEALLVAQETYPVEIFDEHGNLRLNDDYIVAFFQIQCQDIHFNPVTAWFYLEKPESRAQRLYDEEVKNKLHTALAVLRKIAFKAHSQKIQIIPQKTVPLFVDTSPKHLAILLDLLKIVTVKPFEIVVPPTVVTPQPSFDQEAKGLDEFILTQLEKSEGEDVTVEEIRAAYNDYCSREDLPRYSTRQFQDRLGEAVKREFAQDRNHSTIRNGHAKRGFRNLMLKGGLGSTPGTDRTLRTDLLPGVMDRCHSDLTAFLVTAM